MFSASRYPTVWQAIPVLEFLQELWTNMAAYPKFAELSDDIEAGLQNLNKWYRKMDDTDIYFICLSEHFCSRFHTPVWYSIQPYNYTLTCSICKL